MFQMDFWPRPVAPQVLGGQQSRQLQVAQSCLARRWHLREPANGATGDVLWKQDVTTRQPIIYFISIWKVHRPWIFDDSIYFSLLDLTGTSETKHQWHQMICLKAFDYPETSPTSPCGKTPSRIDISWQDSLTAIVHSKVRVKSEETCRNETKLIITSLWEGCQGCLVSWSAMISRPGWLVIYIEMTRVD